MNISVYSFVLRKVNQEIRYGAEKYVNLKYNDKFLNPKIEINNLNIKKYCMDDLLNDINHFLQTKSFSHDTVEISKILINYLPALESNDMNDKIP